MIDSDHLRQHLPIAFFVALFGWLSWLLWRASKGDIQNPFVSAAASFTLVAVTIYYAWQSRKSAQHTQETLVQMRKDREKRGKSLMIGFGIDPLSEELKAYKSYLEKTRKELDMEHLLPIDGVRKPDHVVVADIDDQVNGFEDRLEQLVDSVRSYQSERKQLLQNMVDYATENIIEIPTETEAEIHNVELGLQLYFQKMIKGSKPEPRDAIDDKTKWEKLENEFYPPQDHPRFGQAISDTIEDLDGVVGLVCNLNQDLKIARKDIKKEYQITEVEIQDTKQDSQLDEVELRIHDT